MKQHLAIFLPSLGGGGAEKVMLMLTERFTARGIHCDLVIAMDGGELGDCVPTGVRVIRLHKHKTVASVFALARYLRHERPDTLLSTIFVANITALAASLLNPHGSRIVLREANGIDIDVLGKTHLRTLSNRLSAKLLYRRADAVIAVAKSLRRALLRMHLVPEMHIHVIQNPAPFSHARNAKRLVPSGQPVILACGRLEQQKDHATLLRAFTMVRKKIDARLELLGEGSLRQTLQLQAEDLGVAAYVNFPGFQRNPHQYMLEASVFVHTARYEGLSNVLLEALAAGCPIVATDCPGGVREVLDDGKYGTLVPVGDAQAIADAVGDVLTGKVQFPDATEYLRKFDIERVTDAYISVLFPEAATAERSA